MATQKQIEAARDAYINCDGNSYEAFEAAIAAAEAAGWEPIETAPKDGTPVDLWCQGQFRSGRETDCWFSDGKWWQYNDLGQDCRDEVDNATHWRPVPEPPAG